MPPRNHTYDKNPYPDCGALVADNYLSRHRASGCKKFIGPILDDLLEAYNLINLLTREVAGIEYDVYHGLRVWQARVGRKYGL